MPLENDRLPRSRPEHFDAVIIGSGFGGSVMAYRLSERGLRVCVLERGQAHPPGSFARAPFPMKDNFWDPSAGLYGIYNVWFFRHLGALVASGVGGGSLIYANVLLRKDPHWFAREDLAHGGREHWPISYDDLEPHYEHVESVLTPREFPRGAPYDSVEKVSAFRTAGQRVQDLVPGTRLIRLPLAVTFSDPATPLPGQPIVENIPNRYGIPRRTCVLCSNCLVGCNHGAKNTLDLTYLTRAERASCRAEIRDCCEVRSFRPDPSRSGAGYEVHYVEHHVHDRRTTAKTITCDRLVLAAGAMGSSYLLLKNAGSFHGLSREHLGTRFSGNGDMLALAMMCTRDSPHGKQPWRIGPTYGPTITHALRHDDALDTGSARDGRGFYIEDSGFPNELAWLAENINPISVFARAWRFAKQIARKLIGRDHDTDLGKELSDLLGTADLTSRTMPLLAMGRDVPDGVFTLVPGRRRGQQLLQLDWTQRRSESYFRGVTALAREIAKALGGEFRLSPFSRLFKRSVTVHPLGGCPMGRNRAEGVVDAWGRVFGHPGFVVADGSILPGPVGPNPALTIAAVADRCAERLAAWPRDASWPD